MSLEIAAFHAIACSSSSKLSSLPEGASPSGESIRRKRVDDVLSRLETGLALTHRPRHLDDPRNDPAFLVRFLERDRESDSLSHP